METPLARIGSFAYRRHPPRLPVLADDRTDRQRHPVLIAGGGPVGLAAALALGRWGIRSAVIEADDSVCEGSRAACVSRRSLEILDRLGVAKQFLAKGLAWTRGRSYYRSEEVFLLEMPSGPDDKFPPMINLEQYFIEQYLLDAIARLNADAPGTIDVRWCSRVADLAHGDDGVAVEIETPLGRYRADADWLLACDGGQSFVRRRLGLELAGMTYPGRYAIVDIELASAYPTERRAWFDPPWAPGTTILMHRQPDDIWRIDFQLAAGEDAAAALQPDRVRTFVQRHLDAIGEGHLPWRPVWSSLYRAGAMSLEHYRHGRVLFAGNAAHALPIFGVRGLNSGFDDADNLAWKLAARIRQRAGDALLDSYSSERVAAFRVNADSAMRSTEFMSPPDRGFELMREAALSLAGRHRGIARLVNPRQTQAITYADSPLSSPDDPFDAGPAPGSPLVEARDGSGAHLTDRLAPRAFTVLSFGPSEAARAVGADTAAPGWNALPACSVPLAHDADVARRYGARAGAVYLVRPDGHVCGRWQVPAVDTLRDAIRRACAIDRSTA